MQSARISVVGNNDSELYQYIQDSNIRAVMHDGFADAYNDFYNHNVDGIVLISNRSPGGNEIINIDIYLPKSILSQPLSRCN